MANRWAESNGDYWSRRTADDDSTRLRCFIFHRRMPGKPLGNHMSYSGAHRGTPHSTAYKSNHASIRKDGRVNVHITVKPNGGEKTRFSAINGFIATPEPWPAGMRSGSGITEMSALQNFYKKALRAGFRLNISGVTIS